jgi:hypothetical protein
VPLEPLDPARRARVCLALKAHVQQEIEEQASLLSYRFHLRTRLIEQKTIRFHGPGAAGEVVEDLVLYRRLLKAWLRALAAENPNWRLLLQLRRWMQCLEEEEAPTAKAAPR